MVNITKLCMIMIMRKSDITPAQKHRIGSLLICWMAGSKQCTRPESILHVNCGVNAGKWTSSHGQPTRGFSVGWIRRRPALAIPGNSFVEKM